MNNQFAKFSKYNFAADGTVTNSKGKVVTAEDSPRGNKYRLTKDDGGREYVYAQDIIDSFKTGKDVKTSTITMPHSKGWTADLSEDEAGDEGEVSGDIIADPTSIDKPKRKAAAPKNAAAKKAPAAVSVKPPVKKTIIVKKPTAAKKTTTKTAKTARTFEVLAVETVALIRKDLKLGTKKEGGYSISELAEKYGKSNSCIVNIKFNRIHKGVQAAK